MKQIIYLFAALSLIACNTKGPQSTQNYAPTPTGLQGIRNSAPTPVAQASSQGNVLLNPKHGEPGHRCDLAVGAPLNSAPIKAAAATAQPTVVPQPVATPTAKPVQTTAATNNGQQLNPPHGQPNHSCDIAVGAPLNSNPQTTSVKTTNVTLPKNEPQEAKNNVKINPAHGQPNHRCDIAVGAPLT